MLDSPKTAEHCPKKTDCRETLEAISLEEKFSFQSEVVMAGDIIQTPYHFRPGQDPADFLPSPFASRRGITMEGVEFY